MVRAVEDMPAVPGAYVLAVELAAPTRLRIARLGNPVLPAGLFTYVGNAYGPGGIRARVRRHLCAVKVFRWHIDHLTAVGRPLGAWPWPEGHECDLLDRLIDMPGTHIPVPRFGSSDCAACPAHLVALPDGPMASWERALYR